MAAGCSETFWTKTPPAVGVAAAAALAEGSTVTVTVTMSVTHWTSRARLSRGMAETSRAPAAKRTAEYFILNDGIVFAWSCRCQVELAKEMELAFLDSILNMCFKWRQWLLNILRILKASNWIYRDPKQQRFTTRLVNERSCASSMRQYNARVLLKSSGTWSWEDEECSRFMKLPLETEQYPATRHQA